MAQTETKSPVPDSECCASWRTVQRICVN